MEKKKGTKKEDTKEKAIKGERKEENKVLRAILLFVGIFFLVLLVSFFLIRTPTHQRYGGLTFKITQEGELTFYHTSFPIIYKGNPTEYNVYLRNNPKELVKKVPFDGEIDSIQNTVINITKEFDCEGDQIIAIANIVNVYNAIGKDIMKDENASCDESGRYMYIVVQPGESTSVEQFGPSCYSINIKDCEILQGTERFILELLSEYHSEIYEKGGMEIS